MRELIVTSDLPERVNGILPWERELLLPVVSRLLDEVLAEAADESESARSDIADTRTTRATDR